MTMDEYTEEAAAEALGVSLREVKRMRAAFLKHGVDYHRGDGGRVVFGKDAVSKLASVIGKKEDARAAADTAPVAVVARVEQFTVNPNLLIGQEVPGGNSLRIRVRDASRFRRGMLLDPCRVIRDGLVEFCGAVPRKGRV